MTEYTNFDELPACLNMREVAKLMRISLPTVYALLHSVDFPAVKVGERRYVIPRDRFIAWLNRDDAAREV